MADEYSARVDIEVDSPGQSHVIRTISLRARSGTARVHAPKDLQVLKLPLKFSFQTATMISISCDKSSYQRDCSALIELTREYFDNNCLDCLIPND